MVGTLTAYLTLPLLLAADGRSQVPPVIVVTPWSTYAVALAANGLYIVAMISWRAAARGSGSTTFLKSSAVTMKGPPGATFWRRSPSDSLPFAGICSRTPAAFALRVTSIGPQLACADMAGS